MNEQYKYEIIKKVANKKISKKAAAVRLNRTDRTVNRLLKTYENAGKSGFSHGNNNKLPAITKGKELDGQVVKLYIEKYYGSNFSHFKELLYTHESIEVSISYIRTLLMNHDIISPKAQRKTKRNFNKNKMKSTIMQEVDQHNINTVDYSNAHPRKERAKYMGEIVQLDASVHNWFGTDKTHLHAAIDNASGKILALHFDKQETLNGYYNLLNTILNDYGIPYKFLTDKRTVFEYKKKNVSNIEKDTFTQFGYACHQLGIAIKTSSIPQSKGQVERLFGTLQSRLIIELRIKNIVTIEAANDFLPEFIENYNNNFALPLNDNMHVFESVKNIENIDLVLSVLSPRKIDNGNCISYKGKYYYPVENKDKFVLLRPKTKVVVIKTFKGELFISANETIYYAKELQSNKEFSSDFDLESLKTTAKAGTFTPAMSHPWKAESFRKYCAKQKHIKTIELEHMF